MTPEMLEQVAALVQYGAIGLLASIMLGLYLHERRTNREDREKMRNAHELERKLWLDEMAKLYNESRVESKENIKILSELNTLLRERLPRRAG